MKNGIKPIRDVSGMICQIDREKHISHAVCRIRYIENDTGDFKYIFTPNYSEIDALGKEAFDGIPGLSLSRRKTYYTRSNRTPVFISERVPANNREDVRQLFVQDGMEGKSKLEWLINTQTRYSGDRLIVRSLLQEEEDDKNTFVNTSVDEEKLLNIKEYSAETAKAPTRRKSGRPPKDINAVLWDKVLTLYLDEEINAKEAAGMLEVSESTFFRRLRVKDANNKKDSKRVPGKSKGRYANRKDDIGYLHAAGARLEAAQAEINKLDGAEFQRLCMRYARDAYGLNGFTASGMKSGTYNTTKGTPDAFWEYPDGSFLVLEAGHYSSNKPSAKKKIVNDIQKCLDYEREHLSLGSIKKIVACYSFDRFTPEDLKEIYGTFPDRDIDLVGPDELAASVTEDFPWIGRELLGISYKSHAVMTVEDFIDNHRNSSYRAPLDLCLVGREEEIENVNTLLEKNQTVIIAGDSGAGKTRFAIEVVRKCGLSIGSIPIAVQATKEDISEELMLCCKKEQNHIILLDDANEISRLSFLPGFLRENPNVKIVATVRSYAFEKVLKEFRDVQTAVFHLNRLQGDNLNEALESSLSVKVPRLRRVIADQSRGNLRLAYFIHRAYADDIPKNIHFGDLIKQCYDIATEWLTENEKNAIRVASILGAHRTTNNEDLNMLLKCIGISHQTYIQACTKLCEKEMMDSVQGMKAISFEEQNLRDYFIYEGFIASHALSLNDVWMLEKGEKFLINIVNILLQVFPSEETITSVKQQLALIWDKATKTQKKSLIAKYNILLGSKGLRFLLSESNSLPPLDQNISAYEGILKNGGGLRDAWILEPMLEFVWSSEYRDLVVEELIGLIARNALSAQDVRWALCEGVQCKRPYEDISFGFEKILFDRLLSEYEETGNEAFAYCLVLFAKSTLKDEIDWVESSGGKTVTYWTAMLNYDDEVVIYRRHVLEVLQRFCKEGILSKEIIQLVFGYSGIYHASSHELFCSTARMIIDLFSECISTCNLSNLELIARFLQRCLHHGLADLTKELSENIKRSNKGNFLFSLIEEGCSGMLDNYDQCIEIAMKLSKEDWLGIIESFAGESIHSKIGAEMFGFMQQYLSKEQDLKKIDWFCDVMLADNSCPFGTDIFYESILRREGIDGGRKRIFHSSNKFVEMWLRGYDEYCLLKGCVASNPEVYIQGWREHGELLSLEDALIVEKEHRGFFARYLCEVEATCNVDHFLYLRLLPQNEDERSRVRPFISDPRALDIIKKLSLCEFKARDWVDEELSMFLFEYDRSFLIDLMQADIRISEQKALEKLLLAFWQNPTTEELKSIGSMIEKASTDIHNYYTCREWLKMFLNAAFEKGKEREALDWMRSLKCEISSKYGIWAEIVCALNFDRKIKCLVSLCKEDTEKDIFSYIAFNMSFEGKSWSGSESAVVLQDIDFGKRLKTVLENNHLYKYVLECNEYIEYCEQRLRDIEVEDFINDW